MRFYHIVRFVGRWSVIDIFMEFYCSARWSAFGSVITIEPGVGALAFCAVVILTMFAAETLKTHRSAESFPFMMYSGPEAGPYVRIRSKC